MKVWFLIILIFSTTLLAKSYTASSVDEFRKILNESLNSKESDEIILEKGYYKTSLDNKGFFGGDLKYPKTITIKAKDSLTYKDVVLNGNGENPVLFFNAPKASHLILKNISIINGNNRQSYGGGIFFDRNLTIDGCKITNNTSENSGAGIYGRYIKVNNSIIYNNISVNNGGGIYGREVNIKDSTIKDNISNNNGAGVYAKVVKVEDSIIKDNISDNSGGGIYGKVVTVINSTISDNANDSFGGGIYGPRSAFIKVINSTIKGNANDNNGGGIYGSRYSDIVIINSKIIENSVNGRGAGIFGDWYSDIAIVNSIISNNSSESLGGAVYGEKISHISLINSTVVGNGNDSKSICIYGSGLFLNSVIDRSLYLTDNSKIYNSYLKSGFNSKLKVTQKNNLSTGKLHLDKDLKPMADSVLIDKGLNLNDKTFQELIEDEVLNDDIKGNLLNTLKYDINGKKRVVGKSIDIGAIEFNQ